MAFFLENFTEAELTLRKIQKDLLTNEEKLTFLNFQCCLVSHKGKFSEATEIYKKILEISNTQTNATIGAYYAFITNSIAENCLIENKKLNLEFYALHKNTNEQMRGVLRKFISDGIIKFSVIDEIEKIMQKCSMQINKQTLKLAIMEHNLKIVTKFFTLVSVKTVSNIL